MAEMVKCPNCGHEFEISELLTHQIKETLKADLEKELKEKESQVEKQRQELLQKEKEIEKEKSNLDNQVKKKLEKELEKIRAKTEKEVTDKMGLELEDLKNQLTEQNKTLSEAREKELELRKKTREIEEAKADLELEVQRKMDEERAKIKEETTKKIQEEHRLKELEKEKVIQDLKKSLEEAKRKAEQGSMQTQGEVLELDLEDILRNYFPHDSIEPVPKGIKGADVIQRVFNKSGKECGTILWETKSTKAWSDKWLEKLKDDQRDMAADIAIIVTQAMPADIENFDILNGVWVTNYISALGLATALRKGLIEVYFAKQSSVGKSDKMEAIYQYLSGAEFRQKVEAIVETFSTMNAQLEREKRAMLKIWKEREKQIQRITNNTVGMYGDIRGIIGASLQEIPALELDTISEPKKLKSKDDRINI